jgi:ATP-binding cassette subfamily B protein
LSAPTVSGKTTLLDLMAGLLLADSGSISIDGVVLCAANRHAWQACVGYVPQQVALFDGSVAANIAISEVDLGTVDPAAWRERVVWAGRLAGLAEYVSTLPRGYDEFVAADRLSGGLRQRLGIARALFRDTPVLLMDEPTSALDDIGEEQIAELVRTLRCRRTVVLSTHCMRTLRGCDFVVRLEAGSLVERVEVDRQPLPSH